MLLGFHSARDRVLGEDDKYGDISTIDTLALTDQSLEVHAGEDSLTITEAAATSLNEYTVLAADTLSPTDAATSSVVLVVVAADSITVTETAVTGSQTFTDDVDDTVSLTESATGGFQFTGLAEDTLTVTEASTGIVVTVAEDTLSITESAAVGSFTFVVSATNTLFINEDAYGVGTEHEEDTLTVTEVATSAKSSNNVAADTLTLTEEASRTKVFGESTLTLTESATAVQAVGASDTLTFTEGHTTQCVFNTTTVEELIVSEEEFDPSTGLISTVSTGLSDAATAHLPIPETVSDVIPILEVAVGWVVPATGFTEVAEDTISLTESGSVVTPIRANDHIGLTEAATAKVGQPATDSLDLTESATATMNYGSAVASDDLNLYEGMGFQLSEERDCDLTTTYSPFVGASSDPSAPTPPPTSYPDVHSTTGFRLQYPETGVVTDELLLRSPNFGDKDRLSPHRLNQETRGGDLIVFADPIWPKVQTLLFSFSGLTKVEARALQTWYDDYLGQEIRLIDHEDRLWRGVITQVTDPIVQDGRGCQWTGSFEFEGEKV